jgi:Ca2+/H+ antiporter
VFDWIGWAATVLFASSYFCRQPATLRRVQGLAAVLWATYGALIHALPVVVANVIVAALALWSSVSRLATSPASAQPSPVEPVRPQRAEAEGDVRPRRN